MSKSNTNLVYKGEVQLSVKNGKKITKIKKKNAGLPAMFKFFAKALSNKLDDNDFPSQVNLKRSSNKDNWSSVLKTTTGISGSSYKYIDNEWKCVLNAQIGYDDLSQNVSDNNYYYRLYLLNSADDNEMAYLDLNVLSDGTIEKGGLDMLSQGSQLLIEWYLGISNPIVQEDGSVSENA